MPVNELDLSLMTINSNWGQEINPNLQNNLSDVWDLLAIYTRDIRLGNLSSWDGELVYCRYFLDLASDFLQCGFKKAPIGSLTKSITIIETSQSKGGFLRRRINTFTQENISKEEEPPKKSLFGSPQKKEGGY